LFLANDLKVAKGKVRVQKNKNMIGQGYKFQEDEFVEKEKSSLAVLLSHGD